MLVSLLSSYCLELENLHSTASGKLSFLSPWTVWLTPKWDLKGEFHIVITRCTLAFIFLRCKSEGKSIVIIGTCSHAVFLSLQCGTMDQGLYVNLTERNLQDAQKFFLMHEVVQPVIPIPYFMEDNSRFSHVVVDVVQGKDMLFHIIYLATGMNIHCCDN